MSAVIITPQMSAAAYDVLVERQRQQDMEGWTSQRDAQYTRDELTTAACCYAMCSVSFPHAGRPPPIWPWDAKWWKPKDARRNKVRAAALLLADIERMDLAAQAPTNPQQTLGF